MAFIFGTAGHVDHGKTSLVRALSGIDCDRLEEEKKRGITIELGFAEAILPNGEEVSIVDVPGHEKFIKNMVSGAMGIHAVLFVISAEEGIMPQTREHMEILSLLGVSSGIIVLTKRDLVDEEWYLFVRSEIEDFFSTTAFANAPILSVSTITGEGILEVQKAMEVLAKQAHIKQSAMPFRLPLDRVFTVKGHGTVGTGSALSGSVAVQDIVQIYPSSRAVRVKAVQTHNKNTKENFAGMRTAINLHNIEVKELPRGSVIATPNTLIPSQQWEGRITCLASSPVPIKHRGQIHFHHQTKELLARIYCLDKAEILPGETAICHIRFEEPMVAVAFDACIIRSCSPLRTIGGGVILNPLERPDTYITRKHSTKEQWEHAMYAGTPVVSVEEIVIDRLVLSEEKGLTILELSLLTGMPTEALVLVLDTLVEEGCIIRLESLGVYLDTCIVKKHMEHCKIFIAEVQKEHSLQKGVPLSTIYSSYGENIPMVLLEKVLLILLENGEILRDGEKIFPAGYALQLNAEQEMLCSRILAIYTQAGVTPPSVKEAQLLCGCSEKEFITMLLYLQEEALMVKVEEDIWYEKKVVLAIKDAIHVYFKEHEQLTLADFKKIMNGLSRKYLVALLEYFDNSKVTLRIDGYRVAR